MKQFAPDSLTKQVPSLIVEIRDQQVMLDFDLSKLYGTETKRLKEAVRRNRDRFPADFMFELTQEEYQILRTQFASLESGKGRHSKYLPFAFTEQGVAMLSSVLNSPQAIQMNIQIIRIFVLLRRYSMSHKDLMKKIGFLEDRVDRQFKQVFEAIGFLLNKDKQTENQRKRKQIGFRAG